VVWAARSVAGLAAVHMIVKSAGPGGGEGGGAAAAAAAAGGGGRPPYASAVTARASVHEENRVRGASLKDAAQRM
jgi:hypothetical protein